MYLMYHLLVDVYPLEFSLSISHRSVKTVPQQRRLQCFYIASSMGGMHLIRLLSSQGLLC